MTDSGPEYAVPALDKALDILELLSDQRSPLTQLEIAAATGRTPSQIFRVLQRLERRGWVVRERPSGGYLLSTRLLELANRQPKLRGLIAAAEPVMRELTESTHQSCNLSVLDASLVRVVSQVESPAAFGFRVRVGAEFPLDTPAGRVLLGEKSRLPLQVDDSLQPGITDLVVPIVDSSGQRVAALTVPYIATSYSELKIEAVSAEVFEAGERISRRLAGEGQQSAGD